MNIPDGPQDLTPESRSHHKTVDKIYRKMDYRVSQLCKFCPKEEGKWYLQ